MVHLVAEHRRLSVNVLTENTAAVKVEAEPFWQQLVKKESFYFVRWEHEEGVGVDEFVSYAVQILMRSPFQLWSLQLETVFLCGKIGFVVRTCTEI